VSTPSDFVALHAGVLVRRGFEDQVDGWLRVAAAHRASLDDRGPARHAAAPTPTSGETTRDRGAAGDGAVVGGRGAVSRVALADGGHAFVRRYVHGGAVGTLLGDLYWQRPSRPLRELAATEAARRAGVIAPEVLAAAALPAGPLLYRAVLVTRALDGRRALGSALRDAGDAAARRAWITCAVRAVRRLHRAGIHHPDLNVGNVLVGARPEDDAALIDFDRARVGDAPVGRLAAALARRRLARSIAKLGLPGLDRAGAARALDDAGLGGGA
jgi:hypothetical protein